MRDLEIVYFNPQAFESDYESTVIFSLTAAKFQEYHP
jgi:hypothetical protein